MLGLGFPWGAGLGRQWLRLGEEGLGGGGVNLGICAGLAWVGGCSAVWDGVKNAGLCL